MTTSNLFLLPALLGQPLANGLKALSAKPYLILKCLKDVSKLAIALSGGKDSLHSLILTKGISGRGFPAL